MADSVGLKDGTDDMEQVIVLSESNMEQIQYITSERGDSGRNQIDQTRQDADLLQNIGVGVSGVDIKDDQPYQTISNNDLMQFVSPDLTRDFRDGRDAADLSPRQSICSG